MSQLVFGLDIGGTGIKGAVIDLENGELHAQKITMATPSPALPESVAAASAALVRRFDWSGPIGCGFPSIIKNGTCLTATNIDQSWISVKVDDLLAEHTGCRVRVANDADVAALCEWSFGAAKGHDGLVMMITIGTGIGAGLIYRGVLVPNCEMGVSTLPNGQMLERYCSNATRQRENLDWQAFGHRLSESLLYIDRLLSPDLFVIGGGVSRDYDLFSPYIDPRLPCKAAHHRNQAGLIGAAMLFRES